MLHPLFLLAIATCLTPEAKAPHIQVALVTQEQTVAPGSACHAGIRFTMEPGWHVYWQHPGDSGEPPTIGWQVSAGWAAGAIAWPLPQALAMPPLMNYGYEHEVLLATSIQVDSAAPTKSVALAAHVTWLVCADNHASRASANLSLAHRREDPTHRARSRKLHPLVRAHPSNGSPEPLPSDVAVAAAHATHAGFVLRRATGPNFEPSRAIFPGRRHWSSRRRPSSDGEKTGPRATSCNLQHSEASSHGAPPTLAGPSWKSTDAQGPSPRLARRRHHWPTARLPHRRGNDRPVHAPQAQASPTR